MTNLNSDEGVINLRADVQDDEPEFMINNIERNHVAPSIPAAQPSSVQSVPETEVMGMNASNKVKVKFDKFVSLIASHDCEDVLDKYMEEDIIISTDLLTDIANSHQEKVDDKRLSLIFFVGAVIGVVITWILLKT